MTKILLLLLIFCVSAVAAKAQYGVTFGKGSDDYVDRVKSIPIAAAPQPTVPQQSPIPQAVPQPSDISLKDQLDQIQAALNNLRNTTVAPSPPPPPPVAQVIAIPPTDGGVPAEIRDLIGSIGWTLIVTGGGFALKWTRDHFKFVREHSKFMQEVGANTTISSTANGFGALLKQELDLHGQSLATATVNSPELAQYAQMLMAHYPEWGPLVGLTLDIAKRKVLAGGLQQPVMVAIPPPAVETVVVNPAPAPPPPLPPTQTRSL